MAFGILITYSGYPYTPSSFMPDNGLANLAGSLIKNGHGALILDYNTVDLIKRLMPQDIKEDLMKLIPLLKNIKDERLMADYKKISARIATHREKETKNIYEEIKAHIDRGKADFVGFKLWMGDGFLESIKIAEMIKKDYPNMKIYAGGPQVQFVRDTIFKLSSVFDALAYGEAEEIINLLAQHSTSGADLEEIPNILYSRDGKINVNPMKWINDLDSIAYPVYDPEIYPACGSDDKIRIFSLDASRGCPNSCAFCVHPSISGRKIRKKSVNRIIDEIKYIKQKYHSRVVRFSGSYTPTKMLIDISKRLAEEKVEVMYTAFSTLLDMKEDDIPLLKSSGLFGLYVGIESADEGILKKDFEKRFHPDKAKEMLKNLIKEGIFIVASFIYPAPSEDAVSTKKTKDYIYELFSDSSKSSVTVHFPALLAMGKWSENPAKYGFEIDDYEAYKTIGMTYNIKQYLPLHLWDNLPYKLNGKTHKELVVESAKFMEELEAHGVLTMLLDETAMMASVINYTPRDFRNFMKTNIFKSDYENLRKVVEEINMRVN